MRRNGFAYARGTLHVTIFSTLGSDNKSIKPHQVDYGAQKCLEPSTQIVHANDRH